MNLQQQEQFYQMMTRLKANSRAASTPSTKRGRNDNRNHRRAYSYLDQQRNIKKITNNEAKTTTITSEPQVWNLTKEWSSLTTRTRKQSRDQLRYANSSKGKKYDMGEVFYRRTNLSCGTHNSLKLEV